MFDIDDFDGYVNGKNDDEVNDECMAKMVATLRVSVSVKVWVEAQTIRIRMLLLTVDDVKEKESVATRAKVLLRVVVK